MFISSDYCITRTANLPEVNLLQCKKQLANFTKYLRHPAMARRCRYGISLRPLHHLSGSRLMCCSWLPWLPNIQSESKLWTQSTDVYAFVVAGLLAVVMLLSWTRSSPLKRFKPYNLQVSFVRAPGARPGVAVRLNGVKIGEVTDVQAFSDRAETLVEIGKCADVIPRGSSFQFGQFGLLAEPIIDITPAALSKQQRASPLDVVSCKNEELVYCHQDKVDGQLGASADDMMRIFVQRSRGKVPYY